MIYIERNGTLKFCFPGLLAIHRNPNCKEFSNCCKSFLRKSSVCNLTDLNPGFGKPWDMLWLFFGFGTFIMLQKESFGQKQFPSRVQKCHFGRIEKLPKWHFWPEHEIKKIFRSKDFFFIFQNSQCLVSVIVENWQDSRIGIQPFDKQCRMGAVRGKTACI